MSDRELEAHGAGRQEMMIGSKQETISKAGTTPKNRLTPWLLFWTLTLVMRIFYRSQPFITDCATRFGLSWTNQRVARTPAQGQPIHWRSHTWIVLKALESVTTWCLPRNQRLKVEYGCTLGPHPSSNLCACKTQKESSFCKIPSQLLKNEPSLFQGCGYQSLKCQRKPAKQRVFFSRSIFLLMYKKGNLCRLALGEILIIQSFWFTFVSMVLSLGGFGGSRVPGAPGEPLQLVVLA